MNDDAIEAILAAIGRRPAVDAVRTERVREAARAAWQAELAIRTRRRRVLVFVSLAAAAIVVAAIGLASRSQWAGFDASAGLVVERIEGVPSAHRVGVSFRRSIGSLRVGSVVHAEVELSTATDARVSLRAPSGHSVRLDSGSTMRIDSDSSFTLTRGGIYVDTGVRRGPGSKSITIVTPIGTIDDVGTQFEARFEDGALAVRVREGEVTVRAAASSTTVRGGEVLTLDAAGRIERTGDPNARIPWAEAIAPSMAIEGRSLLEFLDWVARERGVGVRFTDPNLAKKAPSIVLRGSIDGMSLEEATRSVLSTCGLTPRFEKDVLVVISP